MSLPIYPGPDLLAGLRYSSTWAPVFQVQSVTAASGADVDIAITQYPLHEFELNYAFLRDGPNWGQAIEGLEFQTMMGFFLAIGGSAGRFLYRNPDDNQVFRNTIATGDGSTTVFPITRTFGANGYFGAEPVGQVDTAAGVNVYLGTSTSPLAPSAYTIDASKPCANTITFASAPASGQAIVLDMSYFYYCKLVEAASFEKFMSRIWTLGRVRLRSCRAGA